MAVLAVEWRLNAPGVPEEAVGFLGRRHREAVEARIRALGGTLREVDGAPLIAVFESATAAVEAALAVLAEDAQ